MTDAASSFKPWSLSVEIPMRFLGFAIYEFSSNRTQ